VYQKLGAELTVVEATPTLLPGTDADLTAVVERKLVKHGAKIFKNAKALGYERNKDGSLAVKVDLGEGKHDTFVCDVVLVSVGMRPNGAGLGLEELGVKVERGFVHVNQFMETAEPGLYAIGDIVAGLPQLAHAAMMEGIVAVTHIAGKPTHTINKLRIPNATYCEPQIGSIGMTEKQARDAGYAVKTGKFPFVGNSKATILGNHGGFIKVVTNEQYGEVLGIHIIGPLATEILSEAAAVLNLEGTIDDMMNMIHAHPTVWEAMGDAFASVRGLQINV